MKREQLARLLSHWGVLEPLLRVRHRLRLPLLTVLTYHRIAPLAQAGDLDPDTLDADPATFAEQLDFIEKHFTLVCADELVRLPYAKLPPNPLVLTFDDGYLDNFEVVLPILRRRGIKATFFVATAYPDSGRLYWWDRISLALARCRRDVVEAAIAGRHVALHPLRDRAGAKRTLLRLLKRTQGLDPDAFSMDFLRAAGVDLPPDEERALAARTVMGWEQVAALAAAGMDVQSHTHAHRVLATLSDEEMEWDLKISRETLFAKLKRWPCALAYPTGRSPTRRERDVAARTGFRLAFTNKTGISEGWRFDPYDVPRIATEHGTPTHFFRAILALPYLSHARQVNAA